MTTVAELAAFLGVDNAGITRLRESELLDVAVVELLEVAQRSPLMLRGMLREAGAGEELVQTLSSWAAAAITRAGAPAPGGTRISRITEEEHAMFETKTRRE